MSSIQPSPDPVSSSSCESWEVHKFGGTSLALAECYVNSVEIIQSVRRRQLNEESKNPAMNHRLCVVVSAMGEIKPNSLVSQLVTKYNSKKSVTRIDKVTNYLISATQLAAKNDNKYLQLLQELKDRHNNVVDELMQYAVARCSSQQSNEQLINQLNQMKSHLQMELDKDFQDLSFILRAVWLSKEYDLEHNWYSRRHFTAWCRVSG
jgi:aspartokinase